MLFWWHNSVDIHNITVFLNFQSILMFKKKNKNKKQSKFGDYCAKQMKWQTVCTYKHLLHLNKYQLSTFLEKDGGWLRMWITNWTFKTWEKNNLLTTYYNSVGNMLWLQLHIVLVDIWPHITLCLVLILHCHFLQSFPRVGR